VVRNDTIEAIQAFIFKS